MASGQAIIVTGDKELDAALGRLPAKLQTKHIKTATRKGAKRVLNRAKPLVPEDSGAMKAAMKVRSFSRNIKQGTGKFKRAVAKSGKSFRFEVKATIGKEFGASVRIDRRELGKQVIKREKRLTYDAKRKEAFFYPAAIELGTRKHAADAPMRRGMMAAKPQVLSEFNQELRKLVMRPK